jgi:hypothetical protein
MTSRRAAAPGPRTVAPQRVTRPRAGAPARLLAGVALVVVVVACGGSTAPPSGPVGSGPAGSAGPAAGATVGPGASPRWPGTTVLAVIALGGADGEIEKAGNDLQAAAASKDLKAMWGAADGLAKMIDGLLPNIDRLEVYDGTKPAAAIYRKAFPELSAGAKQLRDSITAGDANGIVAGSRLIAQGLADYGPVRDLLGDLVEQAILQQRLLVK